MTTLRDAESERIAAVPASAAGQPSDIRMRRAAPEDIETHTLTHTH